MLVKSNGLVLKKTPYSDNTAIYSIFTQNYGILTFMVQGLYGKSGKSAVLQPGNLIELVFYYQHNRNLKRLKEVKLTEGFHGYLNGPVQLQVMTFCVELIQKSLPEEQEDPHAFEFVKSNLTELANATEFANFPLKFLLSFAECCGLGLQLPSKEKQGYFLLETNENTAHSKHLNPLQYLDEKEVQACSELEKTSHCSLNIQEKRLLTEKLLYYFKIHLFPDKEIRSFPILMEVLG